MVLEPGLAGSATENCQNTPRSRCFQKPEGSRAFAHNPRKLLQDLLSPVQCMSEPPLTRKIHRKGTVGHPSKPFRGFGPHRMPANMTRNVPSSSSWLIQNLAKHHRRLDRILHHMSAWIQQPWNQDRVKVTCGMLKTNVIAGMAARRKDGTRTVERESTSPSLSAICVCVCERSSFMNYGRSLSKFSSLHWGRRGCR